MVSLRINNEVKNVDAPPDMPLLWVLRDILGLTGTKFGCGIAQCGACTVHVDGAPVRSCLLPVGSIGQRAITTIEGVGATGVGAKVQQAWLDLEVIQCAATANRARSCRQRLCSTPLRIPKIPDIDAAMAEQHLPMRHLRCASACGDQTCCTGLSIAPLLKPKFSPGVPAT